MKIKKILPAFLMIACFAVADTPVSWQDLRSNIDSWMKSPVSLLLTDQEKDVYKKLKTPEEKMQFIKIFWARRDPILRTRENEFKEEFYRRVEYANKNFAEGENPGWSTARGRVYILFGPPSREEKRAVPESSRPALLWVYDKIPSNAIPKNEALMFVFRELKYVLLPPNPDPGDVFADEQRRMDSAFRYQSIPSVVQTAFVDAAKTYVIDEKKDYKELLFSVNSTEKFGIAQIRFDVRIEPGNPPRVVVKMNAEDAPVYDDGQKVFAEFYFRQQLKKGETVVAKNEHTESFSWDSKTYAGMKEISVELPVLEASAGEYELWVLVQDRISNVSEERKFPIQYR